MGTHAGRYIGTRIKQRRRAFYRKHWWRLAVVAAVLALIVGATALLFPDWYVPGWAAILFAVAAVVHIAREQIDGTYYLVSARQAEQWTSKDLARMLGHGWEVVDGISFWNGDADHVVVGPTGVYLIETKHTDSTFDLGSRASREVAEAWIEKLDRRARTVTALLRTHQVNGLRKVILIWGGDVSGTPICRDDVLLIHRSDLRDQIRAWKKFPAELDPARVEALTQDLRLYQARRKEYVRQHA